MNIGQDPMGKHNKNRACRVCLDAEPLNISYSLADKDVRNLFEECTSLKVVLADDVPAQLCGPCYASVLKWSRFKYRAEESDRRLKENKQSKTIRQVKVESTIKNINYDEEEPNIKPNVSSSIHVSEGSNEEDHADFTEEQQIEIEIVENIETVEVFQSSTANKPKKKRPNPPIVCEYCGMVVPTRSMPYHISTKHQQTTTLYKCSLCDKTFQQKNNLVLHEKKHTGQRDFKCAFCDKAYYRNIDLKEHIAIIHEEKRFHCGQCPTVLKSRFALAVHTRTHTGAILPTFRCDVCGKEFKNKPHLLQHHKIHTGEKPFGCDECNFTCNRKDNLKAHKRVHNK